MVLNITVVGSGRAGSSFALALSRAGHVVDVVHHDNLSGVRPCDAVMLCVPDDSLATVAAGLAPSAQRVVIHVAGSRGLDELAPHPRVGLMHPLVVLPDPEVGSERLVGARYSVAGDEAVDVVVASLGGRTLRLRHDQRAAYHACASVAANHLVALMGQVEVIAESVGLTLDDFVPLAGQALEDVARLGVARALTGPASRADMATIDAHLGAIPPAQRSTYVALANAAFELAERHRVSTRV